MYSLTEEQSEVLQAALNGHNIFVTGQAGTGKSFLVKEIYKQLTLAGKVVAIVCSTGIACTVYGASNSSISTVHSFYGLGTADLPWSLVADRSTSNNLVSNRVRRVDCIIWDEISMISRRMFEIVNRIHLKLEDECHVFTPMAGKQTIVVGDFLQLRPVPNTFDMAKMVFESPVFSKAISHRVQLSLILRQKEEETELINCLKEIRLGQCSEKSLKFLQHLSRELSSEKNAVHIFFRRLPMQVFNLDKLFALSGELFRFESIDKLRTTGMKCPADEILLLKPGCRVMFIWNKTEQLRNGTAGIFVGVEGNQVVVDFEVAGKVALKRETWEKRSRSGGIIGTRTQFPITLMYAVTCHKAQGLTLPAAVIHCSKEFVPGLIYVSLTRVKRADDLQVLNFSPNQLIPPSEECLNVCSFHKVFQDEDDNERECCRNTTLEENEINVEEGYEDKEEDDDEGHCLQIVNDTDKIQKNYFARGDANDNGIDLETICLMLMSDDCPLLSTPPESYSIRQMLHEMKVPAAVTQNATGSAKCKNKLIDELLEHKSKLEVLGNIFWCKSCQIILKETLDAIENLEVSSRQWYENSRQFYLLITRSPDYLNHLEMFFQCKPLTTVQSSIGAEPMQKIYEMVIKTAADFKIKGQAEPASCNFNVRDMPPEGLAKLRHVGALALQKVLVNQRKYVREHMTTSVPDTRKSVKERLDMCNLLEDNLIANVAKLQGTTSYPRTLNVTEDRQYRNRGLSQIEDEVYEFFIELEVLRVNNINDSKLLFKEKMIDEALNSLRDNVKLQDKWLSCFPRETVNYKMVIIIQMFDLVIEKYVRMGAGQYMRDFKRAHRLKKTAEHRKRVLQKKKVLEEKRASISIAEMKDDSSLNKVSSHHKLIDYVTKFGQAAFMKAYKKEELVIICKAYGVKFNSKTTKLQLTQLLIPILKFFQQVPHPSFLGV